MPKDERKLFDVIGSYLHLNLFDYYKEHGNRTGSDREIATAMKMEYTSMALALAKEYKLKYYPADNDILGMGDGCECCGTEALHDYKIWGDNLRSRAFPAKEYASKELGKCLVNFVRNKKDGKTMYEVVAGMGQKDNANQPEPVILPGCLPGGVRQYTDLCPTVLTPTGGGHIPMVARPVLTPDRLSKRQNGRRMKDDGDPMFTLTSQDKHGVEVDNLRIRRLTPVECERLQGFPDGWTEGISESQRYQCLGNAVTVNVIEAIGKQLLQALEEN
jgi:hypothetical protein